VRLCVPIRSADTTRRRRNFDLHVQLAAPLRDWHAAVSPLDPNRVRWELPGTASALPTGGGRVADLVDSHRTGDGLANAIPGGPATNAISRLQAPVACHTPQLRLAGPKSAGAPFLAAAPLGMIQTMKTSGLGG
jgi:hypothetical protein